jgi:hypothetical protein
MGYWQGHDDLVNYALKVRFGSQFDVGGNDIFRNYMNPR